MPKDNNIGHSTCTVNKQAGFKCVIDTQISIVKSVITKHKWAPQIFYYIDLYAGDGSNAMEGCPGSPVIFLQEIQDKMKYSASFIEIEPGNTIYLKAAVQFANSHTVYTGDNAIILPQIIKSIPRYSYGLIYADPNGIPNFDMLSNASKHLPKMDILIRCPATAIKRNGNSLQDFIHRIDKSNWLVQRPEGKWQWTFLFATNYTEYPTWKKLNMHNLQSNEGKEIFRTIAYTEKERTNMDQPNLFVSSLKEIAIERSNGICEKCGTEKVSECHHLSYYPEKVIAICHKCHCVLHGVEN